MASLQMQGQALPLSFRRQGHLGSLRAVAPSRLGRVAAPPARRAEAVRPQACLLWWRSKAAVAAPPAAAALLEPSVAFTAATVLVLPVYFAMIAFPAARLTRRLVDSPLLPLLLGVPYAVLFWQAWQGGALAAIADAVRASSPLPDAAALAGVFRTPVLTAMAWLHLLLLDLLQARAVLLDGLKQGVPTGHSIALCCMFGPLGVLSHLATRWAVPRLKGSKAPIAPFA